MKRNFPNQKSSFMVAAGQKGVVLVMALVLLVLIVLLGLTALNASIVQEKMAGNAHHYNVAFQSAESGLHGIEQVLMENTETSSGIELKWVQINSQNELTADTEEVSPMEVVINEVDFKLWGKGTISHLKDYFKDTERSAWWQADDHTTDYSNIAPSYEGSSPGETNTARVLVEQGRFIPDDLSIESAAEFRGRQEFIAYSRAESNNQNIESTLRSNVLVRYR